MLEQQVTLLKQFIQVCKADPNILHNPKLSFYKEYLERLVSFSLLKFQKQSIKYTIDRFFIENEEHYT